MTEAAEAAPLHLAHQSRPSSPLYSASPAPIYKPDPPASTWTRLALTRLRYDAKMTVARAVSLVFPPHWYYAAVPADLIYTGSYLHHCEVPVQLFDLSAGLLHHHLQGVPGYQALRQRATYLSPTAYTTASSEVEAALAAVSSRYQVDYAFRCLSFPDIDEQHVPSALAMGLRLSRNPALPLLQRAVPAILRSDPVLVAVALVHPDQLVQTLALGRLLRAAGYRGFLTIYGAHEDVLSPEDLLDDLLPLPGEPLHRLFDDFDGAIIGEAETALHSLHTALSAGESLHGVPSLLAPRHGLSAIPVRGRERLRALSRPDFRLIDPTIYPYPEPLVDVRMSRGCPWNRCTFCAITRHQEGYRALPVPEVEPDLLAAHRQLGAAFFRFRDDLLTPKQLLSLAQVMRRLPFAAHFSVRSRFEPELTFDVLSQAKDAGLGELWLGLESASPRVRELMQKGVEQPVVERILADAARLGIRVRALCLVGYPGETAAERHETIDFLDRHQHELASAAITPFLLMRRSPLGEDPAQAGMTLLADSRPRHERLRPSLQATWPDAPSRQQLDALLEEAVRRLGPRFLHMSAGPTLAHALIHHCVRTTGWPKPTTLLPMAPA